MQKIDTLLYPAWILPIEPKVDLVLKDHAAAINKGLIVDILPAKEAQLRYQSENTLHLDGQVLLPGFVNTHTHSPMCYFRSLADDLPLMTWLNDYIWPIEKKWISENFVRDSTMLAIAEMLKSGTTCFHEHYFFPEVIGRVASEIGMRGVVGIALLDFETPWAKTPDEGIEKGLTIFDEFKKNAVISVDWAPHAPYTVSDKYLLKIKALAEELNTTIHIHVHETKDEIEMSFKNHKMRPIKRLNQLDILSCRTQCVHATQIDEEDLYILQATGANVVHCPESNLKLASGFCPVQKLLDRNINVALGTDGAASNNDLSMIGEMRTASLLAKGVSQNPEALPAPKALEMATLNGARALGLDKKIGSLLKGKSADMISIDLHDLSTQPMYHPIAQIVYAAHRRQVKNLWIAGKQLLSNGALTTIDEEAVLRKAGEWRKKIAE